MARTLPDTKLAKRKKFCARTKQLRKASGMKGPKVAERLGMEYDTYKKWESRNPMPSEIIDDFCFIVGGDPTYLSTGVSAAEYQPRKTRVS